MIARRRCRGGSLLFACSLLALPLLAGCLSPAARSLPPAPAWSLAPARPASAGAGAASPSLEEWRQARARLSEIRRHAATPRTLRLSLSLREPVTGRTLEARGAAAIAPPDALRMILLGPGGTTALDLWLSRDRFRFAVPAIDLLRRGDRTTPRAAMRGLPIEFLRWWLLGPATGSLLWAGREQGAARLLLRSGAALVDLRVSDAGEILAHRATWTAASRGEPPRLIDEEAILSERLGCAPVRYWQASTGLEITVRCEGEDLTPPNPRAFDDPDAAPGDEGEGEPR